MVQSAAGLGLWFYFLSLPGLFVLSFLAQLLGLFIIKGREEINELEHCGLPGKLMFGLLIKTIQGKISYRTCISVLQPHTLS